MRDAAKVAKMERDATRAEYRGDRLRAKAIRRFIERLRRGK